MTDVNRLKATLAANVEMTMGGLDSVLLDVELAAQAITQSFLNDGKLICCGSSATASISEYCAAIFAHRLQRERPGLPTMALTGASIIGQSIAHSVSQHEVHARQIRSLGDKNDCLLIYGPGGDSPASVRAVSAGHDREIQVVAITGSGDTDLSALLTPDDIEIRVQTNSLARLAEAELLLTHCLCESVEYHLFALEQEIV